MSKGKILVYGGSFNPPGYHHVAVIQELIRGGDFDKLVILPCGPRPDKPTVNDINSIHRAAMVDMAFGKISGIEIDLSDLKLNQFTTSYDLGLRFSADGWEVYFVVGSDLIAGGRNGESAIQAKWSNGEELWENSNFVVAVSEQSEIEFNPDDLPPNSKVVKVNVAGSSSEIRRRVFEHQPIDGLVPPEILDYVERYGLYRGVVPSGTAEFGLDDPRPLVVFDCENPKAVELASRFESFSVEEDANIIIVIGGDGFMLKALRGHWRERLPFFGINAGHLGFRLNDVREVFNPAPDFRQLELYHLPALYVVVLTSTGEWEERLAFNDAWVEREGGQTAWIEVTVNGNILPHRLEADGVLVSTAAGSTAYAYSMGADPLPINAPLLRLVGNNPLPSCNFPPTLLYPDNTRFKFKAVDPEKRPIKGFFDSVPLGGITQMRVEVSRIATVELAFIPGEGLLEKLTRIRFGQ